MPAGIFLGINYSQAAGITDMGTIWVSFDNLDWKKNKNLRSRFSSKLAKFNARMLITYVNLHLKEHIYKIININNFESVDYFLLDF